MRGNRDRVSRKSIFNRETISRQEHRISEYRKKIESNDAISSLQRSNTIPIRNCSSPGISSYCYIWQMDEFIVWKKVGNTQQYIYIYIYCWVSPTFFHTLYIYIYIIKTYSIYIWICNHLLSAVYFDTRSGKWYT